MKVQKNNVLEYLIIHYRWVFVCLFLLPLSVVYDCFYYVRNRLVFWQQSAPRLHDRRVQRIQTQVRRWKESGSKSLMCTGRPGWVTVSFRQAAYKDTCFKINVNLVDILEVNQKHKVVRCEPMVTMGQLTRSLLLQGWTIPVVPELDDLTVGGLVNGSGLESSSHIHGLFQNICVSYEVVLADGSLVKCSRDDNSDLFYAIPWSHGSLGFLVSVELKIIPAKKYVQVHYMPCYTAEDVVSTLEREATKKDPPHFVEGIVFTYDTAVIISATMTDSIEPNKLNQLSQYHKPWFFEHARSFLQKGASVEYIPLRDYYHRHTRSLFWELMYIIPFGNHWLFRRLFGWMIPPKISLLKLTQSSTTKRLYETRHAIQDLFVPICDLKKSLQFFNKIVNIYPIWLCPFKLLADPGFVHPKKEKAEMYVDVGLYGEPKAEDFEPAKTTRKCEAFVQSVSGFQMLYADSYQTMEEFREMFDHKLYDSVRKKYNCRKAFPDVYHKVNKSARK